MSGRKEYKEVLYLIDFGLSKKYRDKKTGQHVKFVNNRRLDGTARYASIHALEGYELSRRDDLEELCYVMIYFLNGHLPWERIKNKNKQERYKLILNMKKKINEENLVGDKNNNEFIEFVKYCRKLKFEENPDYDYLRGLMIKCISKNNKSIDNFYNIDINKNPLFHSQERNDKPKGDSYYKNISQNISGKNTRCNSTKRLKINFSNKRLIPNENNDNNENDDYDNKIINELKSSSLGYIEKKVRNYSNFKNHGIKEIQHIIEIKKKQNNNINYKNISQNISAKNTRCNSTKRLKINFSNKKIVSNENNENDNYDNKIINESKSSSVDYIEKKVRNYSNFKNHEIKGIQQINDIKKKQNNTKYQNYILITKNKTAFRGPNNNIQRISFEHKKYSRSRFSFIKRSFGIEQKSTEMVKNDFDGNLKKNISDINNDNNDDENSINNKDDGCLIL